MLKKHSTSTNFSNLNKHMIANKNNFQKMKSKNFTIIFSINVMRHKKDKKRKMFDYVLNIILEM